MASTGEPFGLFWDSENGDRTYSAASFEYWLKKFFTSGVFNGDLQVLATSGMTVKVTPGYTNVDGKVKFWNAEFNLTLQAANSTYPRIDTIVITRDNVNRQVICEVVTGAYSGDTPQPTAPVRNAEIYQLVLAQIYVGTGVTEIIQSNITDTRPNNELCGYITGTVEELDFSAFTTQFEAYFEEFKTGKMADFTAWEVAQKAAYASWFALVQQQQVQDKADWDAWYAALQEELHNLPEDTAEYLQIQIDEIRNSGTTGSILNISTTESTLEGKTVTVTNGTETRTATFDENLECVIAGYKGTGEVTISSTDGIQTATEVINIPYFGNYDYTIAFWAATVNIQGDSNLKGTTVTIKDSDDVTVDTVTLSAVDATGVFTATKTDTYTFSVTYDGKVYSETLAVTQETTYSLQIATIPEGSTITPINDIQIWLHCAGIYDKTYTTLDEVLADSSTLLALISDHNSVDYMVRSTEWSGNGQPLVPTMTSNIAPSGVASASSEPWTNQGYYAYKVFMDGTGNYDFWLGNKSNAWLQYEFPSAVYATKAFVKNCNGGASNPYYMQGFTIQGSNDGNTFYELVTDTITQVANSEKTVDFTNNIGAYKYYRIIPDMGSMTYASVGKFQLYAEGICSNQTAMGYIGNNDYAAETLLADATWLEAIVNSEYIESVLNVKVPSMTSATAPSGQVFASSEYSGEPAWSCFSLNEGQWSTSASNTSPGYIGYKFTQAVQIKALYVKTQFPSGANTIKLQYSDDNSVWNDTTTIFTPTGSYPQEIKMAVESNYGEHLYWRLYYTANAASYKSTKKIQFYGRA